MKRRIDITAYYENAAGPGAARFLRDAIVAWCIEQA